MNVFHGEDVSLSSPCIAAVLYSLKWFSVTYFCFDLSLADWDRVEHCTFNHFVSVGCERNAGAREATASCSRLR